MIEDVVILENEVTTQDAVLGERTTVTRDYDFPTAGYYFIGRDYTVTNNDMLWMLGGNTNGFGTVYYNCWVENDDDVKLEYVADNGNGVPGWIPNNGGAPDWAANYDWELLEGYQLFTDYTTAPAPPGPHSFSITDYMVEPEYTPIIFPSAGIYYIPYFPGHATDFDDAIDAFAGIFDELDWVMDSDGNRLHHEAGPWVDNIGEMSPLEGYKIKMNAADTLYYPEYVVKSRDKSVKMEPEYFIYNGGNAADWTYTIYIETDEFEIGDEIAAFSNGVMVGSMVIDSEDPWECDLNTFYDAVDGGYVVNTPIELVAYDASEMIDYSVEFEMININSACYPGTTFPAGLDQFSYAHIYRGTVNVDENQVDNNVRVYPNPTNGILNIESVSNINQIHVYNIYGSLVSVTDVNAKRQHMDVSSLSAGTYMVQLHTDTGVITKRVIIK